MAQVDQTIRHTWRVLRDPVASTPPARAPEGADIPTGATDGTNRSVVAER